METAVTALSLAVFGLVGFIVMLFLDIKEKTDKLKLVIRENKMLRRQGEKMLNAE